MSLKSLKTSQLSDHLRLFVDLPRLFRVRKNLVFTRGFLWPGKITGMAKGIKAQDEISHDFYYRYLFDLLTV